MNELFIVENASFPINFNNKEIYRDIAIKNIISRFKAIPNAEKLTNVNDYTTGEVEYIDSEIGEIMVHRYDKNAETRKMAPPKMFVHEQYSIAYKLK